MEKMVKYFSNYESQPEAAHVKHRCFTDYIEKNYPDFKLINIIKNRYPYDINNPENTSFADFYFFKKDD